MASFLRKLFVLDFEIKKKLEGEGGITLRNMPGTTFSKEHQTGVCHFDALSRAKVALNLSFS